jgi:hypothetical protein
MNDDIDALDLIEIYRRRVSELEYQLALYRARDLAKQRAATPPAGADTSAGEG